MIFGAQIQQNPESVCPPEIMASLDTVDVRYIDFEGRSHLSEIVVARNVMAGVRTFFNNAYAINFPVHEVAHASEYDWDDEKLMAENVSSGFNYRFIDGSEVLSAHARGLAFDINPVQNPYVRFTDEGKVTKPDGTFWNPKAPGTLHRTHKLVLLMKSSGWTWGGDWAASSGRTDYQHFEKLC